MKEKKQKSQKTKKCQSNNFEHGSSLNLWGLKSTFTMEPTWYKMFIVFCMFLLIIGLLMLIGVAIWKGNLQLLTLYKILHWLRNRSP